jgi:uncharacterized damage-inducible protein DinB
MTSAGTDRREVHEELEQVRRDFHALVSQASAAELRRRSAETRWTNQQLLFHMAFGYMIVRALLPLVRTLGRLPDPFSRGFARALDTATRPFHLINYLGSCAGAVVFHGPRLIRRLDRTIQALHRSLDRESDLALQRHMHFPVGWDPFFTDTMRLANVYHYATQHYDFHRGQLTLDRR